jgi:uncharacterized phosphosugar-binding protein
MDDPAGQYFDAAISLLARARDEESAPIAAAASAIADAIADGNRVFAFGAGHSSLAAQDLVYRAGGLALVNLLAVPGAVGVDVMPATLGSALERVSGLAATVLDASPARRGDVLIVVSLSGRNALPVEMAQHARTLGLTVIGVTSLAYARTGSRLNEHSDIVLDTKIAVGDATLSLPSLPSPFAPASTVVTSALLQAVVATAVATLAERGITPPVLRSGNVDGGLAWNNRLFEDYGDRIFYQH